VSGIRESTRKRGGVIGGMARGKMTEWQKGGDVLGGYDYSDSSRHSLKGGL